MRSQRSLLGPDGDFDYAFAALAEEPVGFCDSVERECVCQQRPQLQAAVTNEFHEAAHALLATGAESRDDFMVAEACSERFEWNGEFAGVDSKA